MILSLNFNHDGSGVILNQGHIAAYVNTERFSRIKKHPGLREEDLDELFRQAGATIDDISFVILCNHGINYPEFLEAFGDKYTDVPFDYKLSPDFKRVEMRGRTIDCAYNPDHFLCHAAASYYFSPFNSALTFAYDPMGSGAYIGVENRLSPFPLPVTRVGAIYSEISRAIGFGGLFGAGKTMGLAPLGKAAAGLTPALLEFAQNPLRVDDITPVIEEILDLAAKREIIVKGHKGKSWNAASAYIVQEFLETVLKHVLEQLFRANQRNKMAGKLAANPNLCLSGGTALNSVANEKVFRASNFSNFYAHPACGDDGTSIGAALYWWHHVLGHPKIPRQNSEAMYSVASYSSTSIKDAIRSFENRVESWSSTDYIAETAQYISEGKIVGWFNGASEIGPRALGNRSILADPRRADMCDKLNKKVKHRESFRPFAPSVLLEDAQGWFDAVESPYMLRVVRVKSREIPAVDHFGSARIQTVSAQDNSSYHALIKEFKDITGVPAVLNTSFNVGFEPIVETPEDALKTFVDSELDYLVFPGIIVKKAP
ncbi:MAG: carbamoyltransferase [Desulfuromonas sp.]|nr:MAG: carbamoyltransferase [Desulfuromonas sp.]